MLGTTVNLDKYAAGLGIALSLAGLVWNAAIQTERISDHDRRLQIVETQNATSISERSELKARLAAMSANIELLVEMQRGEKR